ncbi:MAG TPA: signal recognition particle protein [Thermotogota bacterium]|nr:signal recognition particle protein [Thermotogota bacterium]NLH19030.1 signal recognition particle protein [Thermotogaceae bacterium]OQC32371.1 MAG: Signal recognition particle protein [Thermotogota bacterium ADurb.Bin062]HNW46277.1 signal recognition particle protein [Thermotogota bacterium]HNY82310.1 signal recognition particle protein [Thermotogota bacterium]
MFESLQEKLEKAFKSLRGQGKISEKNIQEAIRMVKLSLLEADVNYKVVKDFIEKVKEKAIGAEVFNSLTPDQQFIKIVRDELTALMGEKHEKLRFTQKPSPIMLVGLQGSGKTTTGAKLARIIKSEGRKVLLVAADIYRPAAIDQLEILGAEIGVTVFSGDRRHVDKICQEGMKLAIGSLYDVVIFDTAGRLHINEEMMREVEKVREIVKPDEVLMVLDAMIGQDAVQTAKTFNDRLAVTGFVLTKMDGDARGGVALSIRSVTGKPIKFIGVSEKIDGLEAFYPDRLSSRILGLGDVLSLIEKVEQTIDEKKAKELEKKLRKADFTFNDFLEQIRQIQKMGSLRSILEMLPGGSKLKGVTVDEKQIKHVEAIICSMTKKERANPKLINYSRKKRIALGSGRPLPEVTKLLDNFENMKKMVKKIGKMGPKGLSRLPF